MMAYISRLVVPLNANNGSEVGQPLPLSEFSAARAVVVLGDAGVGKTEELRHAAENDGLRTIAVQEFIHRAPSTARKVFLDGLDEARGAGGSVAALRAKLSDWGTPDFVLSCRIADWFGS